MTERVSRTVKVQVGENGEKRTIIDIVRWVLHQNLSNTIRLIVSRVQHVKECKNYLWLLQREKKIHTNAKQCKIYGNLFVAKFVQMQSNVKYMGIYLLQKKRRKFCIKHIENLYENKKNLYEIRSNYPCNISAKRGESSYKTQRKFIW